MNSVFKRFNTFITAFALLAAFSASAGCRKIPEGEQTSEIIWSYNGQNGPEHWGDLGDGYEIAKTGKEQSPVNIITAKTTSTDRALSGLEFFYVREPLGAENNGHTIELKPHTESNYIMLDGEKLWLAEVCFHAKSEHALNDTYYPLEMQLVHKNQDGQTAIISVFIETGGKNNDLGGFFDIIAASLSNKGDKAEIAASVDISRLIPSSGQFYRYNGSLTVPVTTEGVKWVVYGTPISASSEQINSFTKVYSSNSRPTQPINERTITEFE